MSRILSGDMPLVERCVTIVLSLPIGIMVEGEPSSSMLIIDVCIYIRLFSYSADVLLILVFVQ